MSFSHGTKIVSLKSNGVFNLRESVLEILKNGLVGPNPKDVTIFLNLDGFKDVILVQNRLELIIEGKNYPVVVEETDEIHKHGDVKLKYNT